MSALDPLYRLFGEVIVIGGGGAGVAFILFRAFGKAWLEARFAEKLAAFEHEQQKELQRLRVEIESILSGALKIQEREFTVLPEAWQKLNDAYGLTQWITSAGGEAPNFSVLDDDELEEFLQSSELLPTQKQRVRSADVNYRFEVYQDLIFWHRLHRAQVAVAALRDYTATQGVFLPPPLKKQFAEMLPILWSALSWLRTAQQGQDLQLRGRGREELEAKGAPLHAAIEQAIADRIHSHGKPKPQPVT